MNEQLEAFKKESFEREIALRRSQFDKKSDEFEQ
jgi:hypothetical protein